MNLTIWHKTTMWRAVTRMWQRDTTTKRSNGMRQHNTTVLPAKTWVNNMMRQHYVMRESLNMMWQRCATLWRDNTTWQYNMKMQIHVFFCRSVCGIAISHFNFEFSQLACFVPVWFMMREGPRDRAGFMLDPVIS